MMLRWAVCAAAAVALAGCQALSAIDSAAEPTELYTVTPKSTFDADLPNV
jgi:cholesterol transport system auxiliary component